MEPFSELVFAPCRNRVLVNKFSDHSAMGVIVECASEIFKFGLY